MKYEICGYRLRDFFPAQPAMRNVPSRTDACVLSAHLQ